MRIADLVMAIVLAVFSSYLAFKSTELPITWNNGHGPGGGAFPFSLSIGMLACSGIIIVRWFVHAAPNIRSSEHFIEMRSLKLLSIVGFALLALIGVMQVLGTYVAIPLFLGFYLRFFGHHPWRTVAGFALISPVVMFFLFEIAMQISLPKGYTEPLFYPIYDALM